MLSFALGSEKLYLKHTKTSKKLLVTLPWAETVFGIVCHLKLGETFVHDCKLSSHPFTGPIDENVGKVNTIIIKGW
jgi:hypothetical protein